MTASTRLDRNLVEVLIMIRWLCLFTILTLTCAFWSGCGDDDQEPDQSLTDLGQEDVLSPDVQQDPRVDQQTPVIDCTHCEYPECDDEPHCALPPTETDCSNGIDDDGDGYTDCEDSDCASHPDCAPVCGDGILQGEEQCEPGVDETACWLDEYCHPTSCRCLSYCGDGRFQPELGELCEPLIDESACAQDEYCDSFCQCAPTCGNGLLDEGEECEPGVDESACADGFRCGSQCTCVSSECGNRILEPGEQCDDGDLNGPGHRCSDACMITPVCGDWIVDWPENCEDGNRESGDGCSDECRLEATPAVVCGDGIVVSPWEECDGNPAPCAEGEVCTSWCECRQPGCGDSIIGLGEECEFDQWGRPLQDNICGTGHLEDRPLCDPVSCLCVARVCGDGSVDGPEQCDINPVDGSIVGDCHGDTPGCDLDTCQCAAQFCGDGLVHGSEECETNQHCTDPELPVCVACRCTAGDCPSGIEPIELSLEQRDEHLIYWLDGSYPAGTSRYGACGAAGSEVVYRWEVAEDEEGRVRIRLETSGDVQPVLLVYSTCDPRSDLLACDHATAGGANLASLELEVQSGDVLYLVVDSQARAVGAPYLLSASLLREVSPDDWCDGHFVSCEAGTWCIEETCLEVREPSLVDAELQELSDLEQTYLLRFDALDDYQDLASLRWDLLDEDGQTISYRGASGQLSLGRIEQQLGPENLVQFADSDQVQGLVRLSHAWVARLDPETWDAIAAYGVSVGNSAGLYSQPLILPLNQARPLGQEDDPCIPAPDGLSLSCEAGFSCEVEVELLAFEDGVCREAESEWPQVMAGRVVEYSLGECGSAGDLVIWEFSVLTVLPIGAFVVEHPSLFSESLLRPLTSLLLSEHSLLRLSACVGDARRLLGQELEFSVRDMAARFSLPLVLLH